MRKDVVRRLNKSLREKRNKLILELKAKGLTVKQISAQVNMTQSGVEGVLQKAKKRKAEVYSG